MFLQIKQVFEPYRVMSKELMERRSSCHHKVPSKERKILNVIKHFGGILDFRIWFWNLTPAKSEGRLCSGLLVYEPFLLADLSVFMLYRTQWILDYQDVVCLAATQVWWTAEVENVFEKVKQVKLFLVLALNNV
jgi:hypothetical protein